MQVIKVSLYLLAFVLANFIVMWFGEIGLIFTALFLVPFDFIMRCLFHERWKGVQLFIKLGSLVAVASVLTYLINSQAKDIALGSMFGFISAQLLASLFYQRFIRKSFWFKVNGSDALGIIVDSIVFQLIAFGSINTAITLSQIALKIIGGVFWYYIIFHKYKFHKQWLK